MGCVHDLRRYPYSQAVDLSEATAGLLGSEKVNYLRNSVKAVVDAYDGSVTYYADLNEPIMQAWDRAFPGVFTPITQAPSELQAHFRYPENLFQAQAFHFANYHVEDAGGVLPEAGLLGDPERSDPASGESRRGDASSPAPSAVRRKMLPSYQLMRLPGERGGAVPSRDPFPA